MDPADGESCFDGRFTLPYMFFRNGDPVVPVGSAKSHAAKDQSAGGLGGVVIVNLTIQRWTHNRVMLFLTITSVSHMIGIFCRIVRSIPPPARRIVILSGTVAPQYASLVILSGTIRSIPPPARLATWLLNSGFFIFGIARYNGSWIVVCALPSRWRVVERVFRRCSMIAITVHVQVSAR